MAERQADANPRKRVEFYFDYGSPTSYLAYTQIEKIAKRNGAAVDYKPVLLGGVLSATGNRPPTDIAAKRKWMIGDLECFAKHYGVSFRWNPKFPINTLALMRGAIFTQRNGYLTRYSDAIFEAMWVDGEDMGNPATIGAVLMKANLDAKQIMAATSEQPIKEALKTKTEEAVTRGVFGAPTFFVGEQMFFGQDRLTFVESALAK